MKKLFFILLIFVATTFAQERPQIMGSTVKLYIAKTLYLTRVYEAVYGPEQLKEDWKSGKLQNWIAQVKELNHLQNPDLIQPGWYYFPAPFYEVIQKYLQKQQTKIKILKKENILLRFKLIETMLNKHEVEIENLALRLKTQTSPKPKLNISTEMSLTTTNGFQNLSGYTQFRKANSQIFLSGDVGKYSEEKAHLRNIYGGFQNYSNGMGFMVMGANTWMTKSGRDIYEVSKEVASAWLEFSNLTISAGMGIERRGNESEYKRQFPLTENFGIAYNVRGTFPAFNLYLNLNRNYQNHFYPTVAMGSVTASEMISLSNQLSIGMQGLQAIRFGQSLSKMKEESMAPYFVIMMKKQPAAGVFRYISYENSISNSTSTTFLLMVGNASKSKIGSTDFFLKMDSFSNHELTLYAGFQMPVTKRTSLIWAYNLYRAEKLNEGALVGVNFAF